MTMVAKLLITIGFVFILAGIVVYFAGKMPWLGRLPGDILIKKENFAFYFPITTCILISLILSIILFIWNQR